MDTAYEVTDDPGRVDVDALWEFLSTEAYWARWRTRTDVERQLASAWRLVSAHGVRTGAMAGFARAWSDGVSSAYLADVYVVRSARGHGLGQRIVEEMLAGEPQSRMRWMLHTSDAHGLYERFGFTAPNTTYRERPGSR